jgi:hypothetical protein
MPHALCSLPITTAGMDSARDEDYTAPRQKITAPVLNKKST